MFVRGAALLIALSALAGAAWSAAWAADLPLKAPALPVYDWTGFYLGGNLRAANGTSSFSDAIRPTPSTFSSSNPASFIGGGQLGLNYEFRSGLVVGAEAMFDWLANSPATFTASNVRAGTASGTINNRWITLATGKVGFAWDRLLAYGKAGGALVGGTSNSFSAGATPVGVSIGSSSVGWTAGAGIEVGFTPSWSAKAEYLYYDLGNQTYLLTGINNGFSSGLVRFGVNYHFRPY